MNWSIEMSKFTAAQLVEFYQKVADGGVIEVSHADNVWRSKHHRLQDHT